MRKILRLAVLALGSVFVASSLAFAQTPPAPAGDAPPAQHHAKTNKSKKKSGKKSTRKKTTRKKPAAPPQ